MSAGFAVDDEFFYGTNGAVEAYVDYLATLAIERLGCDTPLAVFFREQQEVRFPGRVVFLADIIAALKARSQFLELLDAATSQLMSDGTFTESGQSVGIFRNRRLSRSCRSKSEPHGATHRIRNRGMIVFSNFIARWCP